MPKIPRNQAILGSALLQEDFDRLNDQQKAIIGNFKGPIIVIAGPGTGKTRTIAVLIGKLLSSGVRLKEILALTFSDKAARELKERVLAYYPRSFDECWISTFHSFCAKILRQEFHEAGIDPEFKLLTGFKEALLLERLCRELSPEDFPAFAPALRKRGFQQEVLTFIGLLKSNLVSPAEFQEIVEKLPDADKLHGRRMGELSRIFILYERELKKTGYLDFRDLIILTVRLLQNPAISGKYRDRFRYVVIDEFQDTDPAQYLLLKLLQKTGTKSNVAVIGDPRQSIYRFRGADPGTISVKGPFKKEFKARVFPLGINYRSSREILDLASGLNWQGGKAGNEIHLMEAGGKKKGVTEVLEAVDELDEARLIARKIASLVIYGSMPQKGAAEGKRSSKDTKILDNDKPRQLFRPEEIAVLVRNNYQIDLISETLRALSIPFEIPGDMKFFRSEEVTALASLLKAATLEGEEAKTGLRRAFSSPLFGLDPIWVQSVFSEVGQFGDFQQFLDNLERKEGGDISEKLSESITRALAFRESLNLLREIRNLPVSACISRLFSIFPDTMPESPSAKNFFHFHNMATDFSEIFEKREKRAPTLTEFMENFDFWLTYYASTLETEAMEPAGNGVKLMTIHQSKGLEFPVVIVPGLIDGTFPVEIRQNILLGTEGLKTIQNAVSLYRQVPFFVTSPEFGRNIASKPEGAKRPIAGDEACEFTSRAEGGGVPPFIEKFPFFNPYPADLADHIEEERRLFFVAITRAEEVLILTYPRKSGAEETLPSIFLGEVPLKPIRNWREERPVSLTELRIMLGKLSPGDRDECIESIKKANPENVFLQERYSLAPREFGEHTIDRINLKEGFTFSANSIKDYLDCPRRFFFRRILRTFDPLEMLSEAIIKGNAVHACLERLHNRDEIWEKGGHPTDDDLDLIVQTCTPPEQSSLDPLARFECRSATREALGNYRTAVFGLGQIAPRGTIHAEENLYFKFRGFRCLARCDRVIETSGGWWIIDYKTGKRKSSESLAALAFPENGLPARDGGPPAQIYPTKGDVPPFLGRAGAGEPANRPDGDALAGMPKEIQLPFYLLAAKAMGNRLSSAMTLYVEDPYIKKWKNFQPGHLGSAAFNLGSGPAWGVEIGPERFASFEDSVEKIMRKILDDPVFDCFPSSEKNARSCRNTWGMRTCEFLPFCQERLEQLRILSSILDVQENADPDVNDESK